MEAADAVPLDIEFSLALTSSESELEFELEPGFSLLPRVVDASWEESRFLFTCSSTLAAEISAAVFFFVLSVVLLLRGSEILVEAVFARLFAAAS